MGSNYIPALSQADISFVLINTCGGLRKQWERFMPAQPPQGIKGDQFPFSSAQVPELVFLQSLLALAAARYSTMAQTAAGAAWPSWEPYDKEKAASSPIPIPICAKVVPAYPNTWSRLSWHRLYSTKLGWAGPSQRSDRHH